MSSNVAKRALHSSESSKKVLVVFEPKMVNPYEYQIAVRKNFDYIISLSPNFLYNDSDIIWDQGHLPNRSTVNSLLEQFSSKSGRPNFVAIVNENKTSAISSSLYAYRIDCIKALSKSQFRVALAGKNWDRPKRWNIYQFAKAAANAALTRNVPDFSKLRLGLADSIKAQDIDFDGPCFDAVEFLSDSQFNLVIENERSYISEKLFNALLANQVPIYIGPSLKTFGIPENVALEFDGKAKHLPDFLSKISEADILDTRRAGRSWLLSDACLSRWRIDGGINRLADHLVTILDNHPE